MRVKERERVRERLLTSESSHSRFSKTDSTHSQLSGPTHRLAVH